MGAPSPAPDPSTPEVIAEVWQRHGKSRRSPCTRHQALGGEWLSGALAPVAAWDGGMGLR